MPPLPIADTLQMDNGFLHAYQWLWIQGGILFTLQDISLWAIFGVAVY